MAIARYASIAEYVNAAQACSPKDQCNGGNWDLGVSTHEAMRRGVTGDNALAAQATEAASKFTVSGMADNFRSHYEPDYYGTRVSIGDYLSGNPYSMRRKVKRTVETPHVGVWVRGNSSGMIRAEAMLRRGCAILGLLEGLQAMGIGVDLHLVIANHSDERGEPYYQVIDIDSRPLDISAAAFAIAHPAFTRNVGLSVGQKLGGVPSSCPPPYHTQDVEPGAINRIRNDLNLPEGDLYIPRADHGDPLIQDPEAWMTSRLAQFSEKGALQ